ncbi:MAG: Major facilitator superfamily 1 [Pedosphaera sp.]|nr:Major facilitator superfamily 1 [Pedosphaera sp.]
MASRNPDCSGSVEEHCVSRIGWVNVVLAAVLMLATLPGRTQGLGLITEPLLKDLNLDRTAYAHINLWATLLGAVFCFPTGYLTDRFGLRWVAGVFTLLLGLTVWVMSVITGSFVALFVLITLTRALGQSALSVVSITAVGKSVGKKPGLAMGIYSVLLSIFFVIAFGVVGHSVQQQGWRAAWHQIAAALIFVITPLVLIFLRDQVGLKGSKPVDPSPGIITYSDSLSLPQALRTSAFWVFGVGIALFGLVSSGLGLFQQAVLAEHGFDQKTYIDFLVVTTLVALLGQLLCGWLTLRLPLRRLVGVGLFLYAVALAFLPFIRTKPQLWLFALVIGAAGGFITVMFFAVWGHAFGRAHLGRIQGVAQLLTVLTSATGPLLFAECAKHTGSYTPLLLGLAPAVLLLGLAAWRVSMPKLSSAPEMPVLPEPVAG